VRSSCVRAAHYASACCAFSPAAGASHCVSSPHPAWQRRLFDSLISNTISYGSLNETLFCTHYAVAPSLFPRVCHAAEGIPLPVVHAHAFCRTHTVLIDDDNAIATPKRVLRAAFGRFPTTPPHRSVLYGTYTQFAERDLPDLPAPISRDAELFLGVSSSFDNAAHHDMACWRGARELWACYFKYAWDGLLPPPLGAMPQLLPSRHEGGHFQGWDLWVLPLPYTAISLPHIPHHTHCTQHIACCPPSCCRSIPTAFHLHTALHSVARSTTVT